MQTLYLLGREQQGLDWLHVLEELCLLDDVDIVLKADGFVQGTPVCKVKAQVSDPPQTVSAALPALSATAANSHPSPSPLAS